MAVQNGSPVEASYTNSKLMSRTQDTGTTGRVDITNTTQSTNKDTGALVVEGGVGVEKNLNVGGDLAVTGGGTIGGNLVVTGDLSVLGNSSVIQTATVEVEDQNILVNKGGNDVTAQGAGITVERTGVAGSLIYDSTRASRWKVGDAASESEVVTVGAVQTFTAAKTFQGQLYINADFTSNITADATSTGSNADVTLSASRVHKFTNGSLVSVRSLDAVAGKELILINATGNAIDILEDVGSPATEGILTGTAADLTLENNACLYLIYDDITQRWRVIGGTGSGSGSSALGYHESLAGTVNGVNDVFGPTTEVPLDDESLIVFVDNLKIDRTSYVVSGSGVRTITFNAGHIPTTDQTVTIWYLYAGSAPPSPPPTGSWEVEYIELDSTDITNKNTALASAPLAPSKVLVDIIGGGPQEYSVDFTVSGTTLSWNSLGLDGLVSAGDKLRVVYIS